MNGHRKYDFYLKFEIHTNNNLDLIIIVEMIKSNLGLLVKLIESVFISNKK
jgi:hypothetical protein